MNDQKLIAESKNFEQHMLDRDKKATKAGFIVGGAGLLIGLLSLIAVVMMCISRDLI